MNLLLRDFDSKEVAENVAAEILKRGVCRSAKVAELRGDLDAAQQVDAALYVTMNEFAGMLADPAVNMNATKVAEIAAAMEEELKNIAALYSVAMGDT